MNSTSGGDRGRSERITVNMFRDSPWPGNILSNFSETPFLNDDVYCTCFESFIHSLKLSDAAEQKEFCLLQGQEAWERGPKNTEIIFASGKVWWRGFAYRLHSPEHFDLVKRGLSAKFSQSAESREALLATREAILTHDYGQLPGKKQSLPVDIFCRIVTEIRDELLGGLNT